MAEYEHEIAQIRTIAIDQIINTSEESIVRVVGMLTQKRVIQGKSGRRFVVFTLEDVNHKIEITAFSRVFEKHVDILINDSILIVQGKWQIDRFNNQPRILADDIHEINHFRSTHAKLLRIQLNEDNYPKDFDLKLKRALKDKKSGQTRLIIDYKHGKTKTTLSLAEQYNIKLHPHVLEEIQSIVHEDNTVIIY